MPTSSHGGAGPSSASQNPLHSKSGSIDINKGLLIIRNKEELQLHWNRLSSNNLDSKTLPSDLAASVFENDVSLQSSNKRNIEVPRIEILQPKRPTYAFRLSDNYLRFATHKEQYSGCRLDDGSIVYFDMHQEDILFLDLLNQRAIRSSCQPLKETHFIKMIDAFEKATMKKNEVLGEINFVDALRITRNLGICVNSYLIKEVHQHWIHMRREFGRPLLRIFWPKTSPHDTSRFAVFRPQTKDKMTLRRLKRNRSESIQKINHLITDLKRVEKIVKKLKQRDEKKLLLIEINDILFDQLFHEASDPTYKNPQWDYLKDTKFSLTKDNESERTQEKRGIIIPSASPLPPAPVNPHLKIGFFHHYPSDRTADQNATTSSYLVHSKPVGTNPIPLNRCWVVKRQGRAGRIWLDIRKSHSAYTAYEPAYYGEPASPNSSPTSYQHLLNDPDESEEGINNSVTGCELHSLYTKTHKQLELLRFMSRFTSENYEEEYNSARSRMYNSMTSPGHPGHDEVIFNKNREAWEQQQRFRCWIKNMLPTTTNQPINDSRAHDQASYS